MKTELTASIAYLELAKVMGGSAHEDVTLEDENPGGAAMLLYTSGTTSRPVSLTSYLVLRPTALTGPFRKGFFFPSQP